MGMRGPRQLSCMHSRPRCFAFFFSCKFMVLHLFPNQHESLQLKLRELGRPITLFGETHADRRERLKLVLGEAEVQRAIEAGVAPSAAGAAAGATAAAAAPPAPAEPAKTFYTVAPEALQSARQFIGAYSFGRAARRLHAQAAVAASPPAAAAEDEYAARLYKTMKRAKPVLSQAGDDRPLAACAFSHDGTLIATGSWGAVVKVWDGHSVEQVTSLRGHSERVVGVAFHPSAGLAHDRQSAAATHGPAGVHESSAATSADASAGLLVSASADATAKIFRLPPRDTLRSLGQPGKQGSAGGPNGRDADAAADDVDMQDGGGGIVRGAGSSGSAHKSLVEVGIREVATLTGHAQRLCNAAWHPSGRYIGTTSFDQTWRLWDAETAQELLLQEGHVREVYALAFHPDGSLAATGDLAGVGRLWDLRSGKAIWQLRGHAKQLLALDFHPGGALLASGSEDHSSIIWDLRQQRTLYTLPAHGNLVTRVKFAPVSGEYLATASFDGTLRLWSTRDWSMLATLAGHDAKVTCVDIGHDEARVLSCGFDRTFKVWAADPLGLS